MTNPTEFKPIKDLRQIDDQGISGDLLLLIEGKQEALNATLSQLASYIIKPLLDNIYPPGVPIPWPRDTAPAGYALINNGFNFDTATYPQLAIAWPSGVIPPHKGRVIECTAQGASVAAVEEGEIKQHLHSINHGHSSTAASSFNGNIMDEHYHAIPDVGGGADLITLGGTSGVARWGASGATSPKTAGTPSGSVSTNVNIDALTGNSGVTGSSRNTVDRINYNYMVRLA